MTTPESQRRLRLALNLGLPLLSAWYYWMVFHWEGVTQQDRVTALLTIIGAYGIGIGFVGQMKDLGERVQSLVADLVDPDAGTYIAANFYYLGMVAGLMSVGLDSRKTETPTPVEFFLGTAALLIMSLGVFVYLFFHALVVIAVSYPAVLVAASVVRAFDTAASDMEFVFQSKDGKVDNALESADAPGTDHNATRVSLKAYVTRDKVAATGFVMGLPAAVLALVGNAVLPFVS